ncbi:MAG: acetolactate synthase small subunit [Deferribacterota bacterium]|nr:acetolactate synthase small subunit [Deferribacterota bacterium]
MRHIISIYVENKFGVLARIAGLFSGRGYNIESLSVGVTTDENYSVITVVTNGDERVVEQIVKQLRKLVNVLKVRDLTFLDHVEREMIFIKVKANSKNRTDIFSIVNTFRAKIISLNKESLIVEITGVKDKNEAFIEVLKPFGIIEVVRTGGIAMNRGPLSTWEISKKGGEN